MTEASSSVVPENFCIIEGRDAVKVSIPPCCSMQALSWCALEAGAGPSAAISNQ